jgi:predicted enzyme related to lactoylglutathione lyase
MVMLTIPIGDQKKGRLFYRALLGKPLARSHYFKHRHHVPVSSGVQLDLGPPERARQPVMATFAVRNLKRTIARLERLGGKVVAPEMPVPIDEEFLDTEFKDEWKRLYGKEPRENMGNSVVMIDPFNNGIVLVEMEDWAEDAFKEGHISDREFGVQDVALKLANKKFGTTEYDNDPPDEDWDDD